jgi:hypothetical protein
MTDPIITESRGDLSTAFAGLGLNVYDYSPPVPQPPCVVILPDSPWIRPDRVGSNLNIEVRWRVLLVVNSKANNAQPNQIEEALEDLLAAVPAGYIVTLVGSPQLTDVGAQGTVTTTELNLSVRLSS